MTLAWNKGVNLGWREGNVAVLRTHRPDELDEVWPKTIGNFAGYHYTNFSSVELIGARQPGLTVPVWNRLWVGDHPDLPAYVEKQGDVDPSLTAELASAAAGALVATDFREVEEAKRRADDARARRPDLTLLSDEELVARARSFVPDLVYIYAVHSKATVLASVGPSVAAACLAGIGQEAAVAHLMSGLGNVDSAAPAFALWRLSRVVRSSPALSGLFDDAGLAGVVDAVATSTEPDVGAFGVAFGDFLYSFGSRASNEWDLRSDSWKTRPTLALAAVDNMRAATDKSDPFVVHERNRSYREELTQQLADRLPADGRETFLQAAASIVRSIPWRERTRTGCVKVMQEMREAVFELGRRMVARGVLTDHRDITMVLDEELDGFVADPLSYRDEIARRLVGYRALFDLEPPFFLHENLPLSQWPRRECRVPAPAVPGDVLVGFGGSPGIARGRARVVLDPYDAGSLAPGDVLVAPQTDPAWTPLFVGLAAVVVNVGAPITHAAIISRELGIPCAASVRDATAVIPEGALVEVDGSTGAVTLL